MGNIGTGFGNQGGGGLSPEVIEVTKADFLSLVGSDGLTFPATYKITDIEAFTGVYINTTSANTFDFNGSGLLLVPDYIPSGSNLGQMDGNNIPSIDVSEKVIWGDHYWVNETGSPITPTITNQITLAGGLTQKSKSLANGYSTLNVDLIVDSSLTVYSIVNPFTGSTWSVSTGISQAFPPEYGYKYAQINGATFYCNLNDIRNYSGDLYSGVVLRDITTSFPFLNEFYANTGNISSIYISGNTNQVNNNKTTDGGNITAIKLLNTSRFTGNNVSGASYALAQIGFIELWDNCEAKDNTIIGDGAIWDVRTGENSKVNNNTINVPSGAVFGSTYAVISDIDQMNFDEVSGNSIILGSVPTNQPNILMIRQYGLSKLNNHTISADNCEIQHIKQTKSELTGFTLSVPNKKLSRIDMINSKLRNGTNISITDFTLKGDYDIDLTGFTTDISSETIENGKGWFTITHDFSTSPLNSGSSVLYNLIPNGSYLTNCTIIPSSLTGGAGATLRIGLESDDVSYGLAATAIGAITNTVVSTISNPATANRSLQLTAGTNDITGGTVTVKVEFML